MSIGTILGDFIVTLYERFGIPKLWGKKKRFGANFVLVGPSGVGKTHVSNSIANDLAKLLATPERTYQTREILIENQDCTLVFFDTPGHNAGEVERNMGLQNATLSDNYGIILVGAYGYHESVSMEKPSVTKKQVTVAWLDEKRNLEFSVFRTVLHRAMILKRPKLIVVLVNKADLWNDDWPKVKSHYERSDFHQEATNAGVQFEVLQYCAMPQKFWGLESPSVKLDIGEAKVLHQRLLGLLRQFAKEK